MFSSIHTLFSSQPTARQETKPNIRIENLKARDVEKLALLARITNIETYHCHPDHVLDIMYGEQFIHHILNNELFNPEIAYLICKHDDQLIGFAKLVLNNQDAFLDKLYFLKAYHGKGYGKALLLACFDYAEANGYKTMKLHAYRHNHPAINFYQRFGFQVKGDFMPYVNPVTLEEKPASNAVLICDDITTYLHPPVTRFTH